MRDAAKIVLRPVRGEPRLLAGADAAFSSDGTRVIAGVVVWDRLDRTAVEQTVVEAPCRFPYIPGLLTFRELPDLLSAFRKIRTTPEVAIADAHGLAHPRRMGLACYLGLCLGIPTIGCAKSRLCGEFEEPALRRGSVRPLMLKGERIGSVLRTQTGLRPVFVSPGNLCDHESATRLALLAVTDYRLPDPSRLAHQIVTRYKSMLAKK